ncbi:hypothetical protein EX30DRAFT_343839 [Ascodesmis nigricans]|uniref:Uncharacterized protein n=1 Tax=Ascodesmis nigricans TaxID=341454 RepID=A0A4S2MRP5_9PEZI|nr:hypothetical protein EX30DRAFT_343839 [Ascodesmis nigricans]
MLILSVLVAVEPLLMLLIVRPTRKYSIVPKELMMGLSGWQRREREKEMVHDDGHRYIDTHLPTPLHLRVYDTIRMELQYSTAQDG